MGSAAPVVAEAAPNLQPEIRSEIREEVRKEDRVKFRTEVRTEVRVEERAELPSEPRSEARTGIGTEVRSHASSARGEAAADSLRDAVLTSLSNQPMLVSMLESAEWALEANALIAKVASSSTMIDMSFTSEARRIATAAASGHAARPIKVQVVPGGTAQASAARRPAANGSARSRAEQDPVVRRMQEKFGAEIRTVIDYREKG